MRCLAPACENELDRKTGGRAGYCGIHYQRMLRGKAFDAPLWESKTEQWLLSHQDFQDDACLMWPFSRNGRGYAMARFRTFKSSLAHRYMCTLAHGEAASPSMQAAHLCGNGAKGCVNPKHLAWKSQKGNEEDKIVHGTAQRGERSASAKLTKENVMFIRDKNGLKQRELAEMFGVSRGHIAGLQAGRFWPDLTSTSGSSQTDCD